MRINSSRFPNLRKCSEDEIRILVEDHGEPSYNLGLKKYFIASLISIFFGIYLSQNLQGQKRYYAYGGTFLGFGIASIIIRKKDREQQFCDYLEAILQAIKNERILVLKALLWLANIDGNFSKEEKEILDSLALEMEVDDFSCNDEISNLPENINLLLNEIQSFDAKQFLTKQIIHLCYCDGAYDAFERKALLEISAGLNQLPQFIEEMEVEYAREYLNPEIINIKQKPRRSTLKEKAAFIGGGGIAGGLLFLTGGVAAPAIGGLIGSQIMGLSGAAAVSAGTAALGLGSLASGGFGIAGGTLVVQTIFAGVGGAKVANSLKKLMDDVEGEGLVNANSPDEQRHACHTVICIHGFLQQGMNAQREWKEVSNFYSNSNITSLDWEAKRLEDLTKILSNYAFKEALKKAFAFLAKSGLKTAGGMIALPITMLQVFSIIDNPWLIAKKRSKKAGVALGKCIADMKSPVSLLGYSLGSRVIAHTLEYLCENKVYGKIFDVYLMAGAVSRKSEVFGSDDLRKVVANNIYNVYT